MRGIHRWPVNSPHKWPVTREMFPFDDVIMCLLQIGRHSKVCACDRSPPRHGLAHDHICMFAHENIMEWKHFPHYCPLCEEYQPMIRGILKFLLLIWARYWTSSRGVGEMGRLAAYVLSLWRLRRVQTCFRFSPISSDWNFFGYMAHWYHYEVAWWIWISFISVYVTIEVS